jgi:CheY-like chemotaxis protein
MTDLSNEVRALFVDDNDDDCVLFNRTFLQCSPKGLLETAANVDSAASKLINTPTPPDVIFVDLRMPGVPGLVLLNWIRSRREFDKVVVIAITADIDYANLLRPEEFGANALLLKPVARDDLARILTLAHTLRQHRLAGA